jgi:hypothetical protein
MQSPPPARKRYELVTNLNNLPLSDQESLAKIAGKCLALKARQEAHGFKVLKFKVVVSADVLSCDTIGRIGGVPVEIVVDGTLPAGTIEAAVMVR